jgi:predicted DNA-binding transcriptional regulator YafY
MNRTDRLLALILELQSSGTRRAEDLARIFETSKRTIYRDMQALCEAGVPVVAVTGQGYSLEEGYFLPPIQFTADEATMLLLGADVMRQSFDAESGAAAIDAARKITGVLPEKLRYAGNILITIELRQCKIRLTGLKFLLLTLSVRSLFTIQY